MDQTFQQPFAVTDMRSPPKQFTYTIANGATERIFFNHNFLRILALSAVTGVTIRFGDAGTPTDLIGAGVGYELNEVVGVSYINNNSGGPITITVVLAIGRIYDDRLNVSGTLNIQNAPGTVLEVEEESPDLFTTNADVALTTAASIVCAANANRKEVFITNLDNAIVVYVGDINVTNTTRRGIRLAPGQTVVLTTTAVIYAVAASGTPSVGIAETAD